MSKRWIIGICVTASLLAAVIIAGQMFTPSPTIGLVQTTHGDDNIAVDGHELKDNAPDSVTAASSEQPLAQVSEPTQKSVAAKKSVGAQQKNGVVAGTSVARKGGNAAGVAKAAPVGNKSAKTAAGQKAQATADQKVITLPKISSTSSPVFGSNTVIFYSPHADDETLSMGVLIGHAIAQKKNVVVVLMVESGAEKIAELIDARLKKNGTTRPVLTVEQVGEARDLEFLAACARLGVKRENMILAHLDDPRSDGGKRMSETEIARTIQAQEQAHPGALHISMSDFADKHNEHLRIGAVLREQVNAGQVRHARFTVSRLYWGQQILGIQRVSANTTITRKVHAAADEYGLWAPQKGRYAVGFFSVRSQFNRLYANTENRWHQ